MKTGVFMGNLLARVRTFFESGAYRPWVAAIVIGLFLTGAWMRFSLPQVPLTNKDTGGYIRPALAMLLEGSYEPTHRNFPYAGFVWILLKATGTFDSIAIVQHILGLAAGFFFWLAWLRMRVFLPRDWRVTALHSVLGVLLVWGLLDSKVPIFFEHSMRAEAIYPLLISLHIFGAVRFLDCSLVRKSVPGAIWWGIFMTVISIGLYVLKPIWGLAVVSGGIPLLIVLVLARGRWRVVTLLTGALGAAAGFVLFALPESMIAFRHPPKIQLISKQLMFVHADIIERELQRDLAAPGEPPFPREIILSTEKEFHDVLNRKTPKPYRTLGFDPDDFMTGLAADQIEAYFSKQPGMADKFCKHYYARAWLNQPLQMLWKIIREMGVFYRFDGRLACASVTLDLKEKYNEAVEITSSPAHMYRLRDSEIYKTYMAELRGIRAPAKPFRTDLMVIFLSVVSAIYLAVLVLFLVAGVLWGRVGTPASGGVPILWLGIWIFSYNFLITLTVAIAHSMSIQRYTETQFCLSVFSFCVGILLLFTLLVGAGGPFAARKMGA
jgi:hypothetical protein